MSGTNFEPEVFMTHLTPKQHAVVVKLVGEQCKVQCTMNGRVTDALWDSGAQVSLISEELLRTISPGEGHRKIEELLGTAVNINLAAANGSDIPYLGWAPVRVGLGTSNENNSQEIEVPFLVTKGEMNCPIIGYNVIEVIEG